MGVLHASDHALALLLRSLAIDGSGIGVVGAGHCTATFLAAQSSLGNLFCRFHASNHPRVTWSAWNERFSGHLGLERQLWQRGLGYCSGNSDEPTRLFPVRDVMQGIVIILFGLMPILNLFSLWDDYLSFHPFSGATMNAYLEIPQGEEPKLPRSARDVMVGDRVYFFSWSMKDTNTDGYIAERVYRGIFRQVCRQVPDSTLVIVSKPEWPSGRTTEKRAILAPHFPQARLLTNAGAPDRHTFQNNALSLVDR